jgi:hypothetical protein
MIDPALLRPGRLDTLLYVPLPDAPGRASIMRTLVRNVPIGADVDVGAIAERNQCEGFSGADLASLVSISFLRRSEGKLGLIQSCLNAESASEAGPLLAHPGLSLCICMLSKELNMGLPKCMLFVGD